MREVEQPQVLVGWTFTGFYLKGRGSKRHEVSVPIGNFAVYAIGRDYADEWMKNATSPTRWEGEKHYEHLEE